MDQAGRLFLHTQGLAGPSSSVTMSLSPNLNSLGRVLNEVTMADIWDKTKKMGMAAWSRTTRRMRLAVALLTFLVIATWLSYPTLQNAHHYLPSVSLQYHYEQQASKYNESKVALLIENRVNPILAPLMLHFISVVPPDWRFRFMGSVESVEYINRSMAIQEQVAAGKLDLTYIPSNMSTGSQEEISRFLTTLWLYEVVLQPAEWLLIFQTDSILCANSRQTLNDYLEYEWVGAPWHPNGRFGGNGGLSLRRVSAIIDVLRNQERVFGSEPEDVWLTERLGHRPGNRLANGTVSLKFSGEGHAGPAEHVTDIDPNSGNKTLEEALADGDLVKGIDDWREGFYEPMGYHTGSSGRDTHGPIWGTPALRKHIFDYCPEIKMTISMDAAKFVPGNCNANWKRWDMGESTDPMDVAAAALGERDLGYGTEIIDGVEYPLLPDTIVPW